MTIHSDSPLSRMRSQLRLNNFHGQCTWYCHSLKPSRKAQNLYNAVVMQWCSDADNTLHNERNNYAVANIEKNRRCRHDCSNGHDDMDNRGVAMLHQSHWSVNTYGYDMRDWLDKMKDILGVKYRMWVMKPCICQSKDKTAKQRFEKLGFCSKRLNKKCNSYNWRVVNSFSNAMQWNTSSHGIKTRMAVCNLFKSCSNV